MKTVKTALLGLFGLALSGFGGLMVWGSLDIIFSFGTADVYWAVAEGKAITAEKEYLEDGVWGIRLKYGYNVGGQAFSNSELKWVGLESSAEKKALDYSSAQTLKVYYDPSNPGAATLWPRQNAIIGVLIGVTGLVIAFLGIGALLATLGRIRQNSRPRESLSPGG